MAYEAKSKHDHEWPRYRSVCDDIGVDRQLRVGAVDRHQYHRQPIHIRPVHGHVLIRKYFFGQKYRIFDKKKMGGYFFLRKCIIF